MDREHLARRQTDNRNEVTNWDALLGGRYQQQVTRPSAPVIDAGSVTNGNFGFRINGDRGPDYTILASTNLTSWAPIFTSNSPVLPYYWVDTNSVAYPIRYYRTVLGP